MKIENYKLKIILVLLAFFILSFFSAETIRAQSFSAGIWPSLLEVTIQPGKFLTQVYKISNFEETDINLTSSISTFAPAGELGNIKLENLEAKSEPKKWFSFQNADLALGQNFILKADKTQEVVLKIRIPADAPEGDYYLTLLFETIPNASLAGQTGSLAQAKIGANILLTVSETGTPPKKASISQFAIIKPLFLIHKLAVIDSFDNPKFLLRIQNTGQAFFKSVGTININGWFNQNLILNLLPENILSQSVRQIACSADEKIGPCQFPPGLLLGRYRATLEFSPDGLPPPYQKTITYLALPIKLIISSLIALILIFSVRNKLK